ncbi:MAG: DUF4058 family protein [Pirellulaceae bacterium]|nr:DUF4058 family protein [Pirellulaceae bacterium]
MPSPFPGMDPYLEMSEWSNFHFDFIAAMKDLLQPLVFPNYLVMTETRVYLERNDGETWRFIPDLGLQPTAASGATWGNSAATVAEVEPETYLAVIPEEHREHYLVLRDRGKNELVTVIEVLSPTNKLAGSDGHKEYYQKRERLLGSRVNLVEIDLLRSGQRPRLNRPMRPTTDYCVFLHRGSARPKILAWEFTVRHKLPEIPVPLSVGDSDINLDLQVAFSSLYDKLGYSMRIPYDQPLVPPARPADEDWMREQLKKLPAKD